MKHTCIIQKRFTRQSIKREVLACREALNLAADLGLMNLHVASDCKELIDDLRGEALGRCGPIIRLATVGVS